MDALLLDKKTVAKVLGLSLRTVDKLIALRELPVRKIGKRALVERASLEKFCRRDHPTRKSAA